MSRNKTKLVFLIMAFLVFECLVIFFASLSVTRHIAYLIGYMTGLHLVYTYIFDSSMHVTGYTASIDSPAGIRLFLFLVGLGVDLTILFYIFWTE